MKPRRIQALKAFAVFVSFAFSQVYVNAALPEPNAGGGAPQRPPITARLATRNNQPINVNGNATATGATLLTGATIETPDQVGATIDLGDAGVVELEPNSTILLEYDQNGNVRVKVLRGCAVARKKANLLPNEQEIGELELYTDSDSEKTDKKKRRHVAGCLLLNGQLGSFGGGGLGAAAAVGIGIGVTGAVVLGVSLSRGGTSSSISPNTQG